MKPDPEICYLSAVEAIERFRARSLSPVEAGLEPGLPNRSSRTESQCAHLYLLRACTRRGPRRGVAVLRPTTASTPPGWSADRDQGLSRRQRRNHHLRITALRKPPLPQEPRLHRSIAARGRDPARSQHHARVRASRGHPFRPLGGNPQPLASGHDPRRLERRGRGGARRRHDHPRGRLRPSEGRSAFPLHAAGYSDSNRHTEESRPEVQARWTPILPTGR